MRGLTLTKTVLLHVRDVYRTTFGLWISLTPGGGREGGGAHPKQVLLFLLIPVWGSGGSERVASPDAPASVSSLTFRSRGTRSGGTDGLASVDAIPPGPSPVAIWRTVRSGLP